MDLLLDTNVLIDFLSRREPFYQNAVKLFAAGAFGDVRLWVPVQSLCDAFYVMRKHVDPQKLQRMIARVCDVVTPVDLTSQDASRALQLAWPDYEDCLISLAAEKAKARFLVTRDADGFTRSSVPTISPEGLLSMLQKQMSVCYDEVLL